MPIEVELIGCEERAAGLEAAGAAGWQAEGAGPLPEVLSLS